MIFKILYMIIYNHVNTLKQIPASYPSASLVICDWHELHKFLISIQASIDPPINLKIQCIGKF